MPWPEAVPLDDNVALYDEAGQLMILLNTSAAAVWRADATVIDQDVRLTAHKLADLGPVVDAGT